MNVKTLPIIAATLVATSFGVTGIVLLALGHWWTGGAITACIVLFGMVLPSNGRWPGGEWPPDSG